VHHGNENQYRRGRHQRGDYYFLKPIKDTKHLSPSYAPVNFRAHRQWLSTEQAPVDPRGPASFK
jgi:hypothetical protein